MTVSLNPEDVVTATIDVLQNNLPAALDAIDSIYSAGGAFVLDDIANADYHRAPRINYEKTPALILVFDGLVRREDLGNENMWSVGIAMELILRTTRKATGHEPAELINVKLTRSMSGIFNVLLANRRLPVSGVNQVAGIHSYEANMSELDGTTKTRFEQRILIEFIANFHNAGG